MSREGLIFDLGVCTDNHPTSDRRLSGMIYDIANWINHGQFKTFPNGLNYHSCMEARNVNMFQ